MAKLTAIPMTEAVMLRIDLTGGPVLIEYTTEQVLKLASELIAAAERSLLLDAAFVARFQRARWGRRRLGGRP